MIRCAITGGLACGKSLLGGMLETMGYPVCDADRMGHELLQPGQPVHDAIVKEFGYSILGATGAIDRQRLGRRVFSDPDALRTLNQIMHPEIRRCWQAWLRAQPPALPAAAVMIPLFFEVGEPRAQWDLVICVFAPDAVCRRRLRQRGWSPRDIKARQRAQWPVIDKMREADIVLDNSRHPAWLQRQAQQLVRQRIQLET